MILCDRGTLDGLAYWPGGAADGQGYGHSNPLRVESANEAAKIDRRISAAWSGHRRIVEIGASPDFLSKLRQAVDAIREEVPECCRNNKVPELSMKA